MTYAPQQICLLHCIYMSNWTSHVVHMYISHYCTHTSKSVNCKTYLPYYCKIHASKKYAPQIALIYHTPKLLDVHQWGKYANIYATYELTGINHVAKSTVHGQRRTTTRTQPQPDYVHRVFHLANQPKNSQKIIESLPLLNLLDTLYI